MAIEQIHATYRVTTPMFSGGADGRSAELRLPSFKGVLRWWWRALAWAAFDGNLEEIRKAEAILFGSAERGQGKILMRLMSKPPPPASPPNVGSGARYLGYGVIPERESKGSDSQLMRTCLWPPFQFQLELRCYDLDKQERRLLLDALRALGLLGGLGARSRRGYGSLALQALSVDPWTPPHTIDALKATVDNLFRRREEDTRPPYTAFSAQTRHVLLQGEKEEDALSLLNRVGQEMMRFHKQEQQAAEAPSEARLRRVVFGLPRNYGKDGGQQIKPVGSDRRASPLLIHIHQCGETPVAVLSFLPALFLAGDDEDEAEISVGGTPVPLKTDKELWQPITDLLDRYLVVNAQDQPHKRRREQFAAERSVP